MASIDKQSVREEFERIKTDIDKLSSQGKISNELQTLINSLMMIMSLLINIMLERKTIKTNKNSSIPSSQTEKDESGKTTKKGKGKTVTGNLKNCRTVETTTVSEVTECHHCHTNLSNTPCHKYERRTKIDIIYEKTIDHIDAEIKECPNCNKENKGEFPKDRQGTLQYGLGIKAFAVHLLINQMVSLQRTQQQIHAMIDQKLSEATLLKYVFQLHNALQKWESEAIEKLLQSKTLHVDETSLRVDKNNHWIHIYCADGITVKKLHRKRGNEAIKDINIIPRYGGVLIHDCWTSYFAYDNVSHGLCGSHLLRELQFVIDSNGYRWASNLHKMLLETCHLVSERESKCLTVKEYANLQKRYRNILTRGAKELPVLVDKPKGKRGKLAKSDAHNLHERFERHEVSVLRFAKESHVPFTNNRAERDLRMAKVKQKVSGCFRTVTFADAYCRTSSYLQSMANQGVNPLVAIQMVLAGDDLLV